MAKFGMKEVADVWFLDIETEEPVLYFESLKMSTLENGAEQVHATGGKGNARLITWDFNRTATFNLQDALIDPKAVAALSGNDLSVGSAVVHKKEVLTVNGGKVTLTGTPDDNKVTVFKFEGGALGDKIADATVNGQDVTLTDATNGQKVIVFYKTTVTNAKTITISAEKFPGYYKVIGDTLIRNAATGVDEPFQIQIPKAKLLPGFTITLEAAGDPSVIDLQLEVTKDTETGEMVRLIQYTE